MDDLVYPHERTLGAITMVLGILVWLALIVGTLGVALIFMVIAFVIYLFAHSALIAHLKGNGVELAPDQFPDLHAQFIACCERLQLAHRPRAFILNGGGVLNAFATKFLRTEFVVLLSDTVDAMDPHPDGVRFYLGHELGHLRMKHLRAAFLRAPVLWLPLLGAAYSRARESTCDRHGRACCTSPEHAARAMAALAAGSRRWQQLEVAAFERQAVQSSGFWMSFHELTSGYPWLTKRVVRVMDPNAAVPRRNAFAYLLALCVPYAGRLGGGFGFLILVYLIFVFAAVAIPAYHDYQARAALSVALSGTQPVRDALTQYYLSNGKIPESLEAAGIDPQLPGGAQLSLDVQNMALTVSVTQGELVLTPRKDAQGRIIWGCAHGEGLRPNQVPPMCRDAQ
jgi:Zn-dependent protease with chaperone function